MTTGYRKDLCPYKYKPEKRRRRTFAMWFAVFVGSFLVFAAFQGADWEAVYHPNQGNPNKKTYVVYVTPDQVSSRVVQGK